MSDIVPVLLSTLASGASTTSHATIAENKTFSPEGFKPGNIANWVDRSGGIPVGYPRMIFQLRAPTKESRVYKIMSKLYVPVLETIDPAVGIFGPKLAYVLEMHMDCLIPERSTSADRLAFAALIRSMLSTSLRPTGGSPVIQTDSPWSPAILELEDVF